jgi:hypothetical protein
MSEDRAIHLQDPQAAAYRALCLGALVMRGVLEQFFHSSDDPTDRRHNQTGIRQLVGWLVKHDLLTHQSEQEHKLFRRELGRWDKPYLALASWRVEALGTLLWAMGAFDTLPAYDTLFMTETVLEALPLYNPVEDFIAQARLRPTGEIGAARDIAEVWHWRSRITRLQQMQVDPPPGTTYPELIAEVAGRAHEVGGIPAPIDGDFPAFGKAYAALTDAEHARITPIAMQRHQALNWLCGYAPDWDRTPIDT